MIPMYSKATTLSINPKRHTLDDVDVDFYPTNTGSVSGGGGGECSTIVDISGNREQRLSADKTSPINANSNIVVIQGASGTTSDTTAAAAATTSSMAGKGAEQASLLVTTSEQGGKVANEGDENRIKFDLNSCLLKNESPKKNEVYGCQKLIL
jgi:hypothetical protein